MSALEPNTAGDPPRLKHFLSTRRFLALIPLALGSAFGLNGLWTYFQWRTWPTYVSLRHQRSGMAWYHYSAIVLGCIAIALLVIGVVLLVTARRRARRDLAAAMALPGMATESPSIAEYVRRMDEEGPDDD